MGTHKEHPRPASCVRTETIPHHVVDRSFADLHFRQLGLASVEAREEGEVDACGAKHAFVGPASIVGGVAAVQINSKTSLRFRTLHPAVVNVVSNVYFGSRRLMSYDSL